MDLFGYVVANPSSLSAEQQDLYRGYYCGLCHSIGEKFGSTRRAILAYDMTFLTILLSSLYDLQEDIAHRCCVVHPFRKHIQITTAATHYAASMNVALAYYNCLDNWHDDKSIKSLLLTKLLQSRMPGIKDDYREKTDVICGSLAILCDMESQNLQDPDTGAKIFGTLLGEIFSWRQDRWSDLLQQMGDMLGRGIYLMDAVLDLPKDLKSNNYNPLSSRWTPDWSPEQYVPVLKIMLGECVDVFERLPIVKNADLLRNILYEGIWIRFYQTKQKSHKEEDYV